MEQEINVKILLSPEYVVDETFMMDIINGLNDRFVPVNQIIVNGIEKFNNKEGFIKEVPKIEQENN